MCSSACSAVYLAVVGTGGKDEAEAVDLEAKTWRNRDGATINYG